MARSIRITPLSSWKRADMSSEAGWRPNRRESRLISDYRPDAPKVMRPYQKDAFQHILKYDNWSLLSPTGSGKSLMMSVALGKYLLHHPLHRAIILSPQTTASNSLTAMEVVHPTRRKETIKFRIGLNLCEGEGLGHKTHEAVEFAKRHTFALNTENPGDFGDRVALMTHSLFLRMLGKLKKDRHWRNHLRNTIIIVDEAHHILNSTGE